MSVTTFLRRLARGERSSKMHISRRGLFSRTAFRRYGPMSPENLAPMEDRPAQKAKANQIAMLRVIGATVRDHGGRAIFAATIGALIAITGWAAFVNVQKDGWSGDSAAWAQAAGSIVAIAGAAWVARGESRHARRLRRRHSEEAAWAVRFTFTQAELDTRTIASELLSNEDSFDSIKFWRLRADNVSLGLQTMLARPDHIHPAVAMMTCNGKVLVDHLILDLAKLEELTTRGEFPDIKLISDIIGVHKSFQELIDQFDGRMRGISRALDRGGDMLPLNEFRSWSDDRRSTRMFADR